jgi:neurotransmitter:Na+ symporter, NSS family
LARETWKSRLGFVFAGVGSAVGLVNIWRFPYVVSENGGGAFILVYILFLFLIGYPVLVSEVLIGRTAGHGPAGAFRGRFWGVSGKGIVLTGFLVSSFYSVVAGWIIGYLVQAVTQGFGALKTVAAADALFQANIGSAFWCVGYHLLFMVLSAVVLDRGVRKGIELLNKWLMPMLVVLLVVIMIRGLSLVGGLKGMTFLFEPEWSLLTPMAILTALGHAFFTLSLGQGTMITYGSYLHKEDNIPTSCAPIVIFDTVVSLLAGISVLSIVFAAGAKSTYGFGLIFATLPTVFATIPGGALLGIFFFLLVLMAAITSQTSAMEPAISALIDERGWKRHWAVAAVAGGAFLVGVPSALSFNLLAGTQIFHAVAFVAMDVFIPLGGLVAVLYVGWAWGFKAAFPKLYGEEIPMVSHQRLLRSYLGLCVRFVAPVLIVVVLVMSVLNG